MTCTRILAAFGLLSLLGACGPGDVASRNLPAATALNTSEIAYLDRAPDRRVILAPQYDVREINVTVPDDLRVSEANMYYPMADIVWRGEPRGDRHQQVRAIFAEAFGLGTGHMKSGPAVIVDAEVTRFHSLTEKTRYTFGGVHAIRYRLTLRDAASGAVIDGPRLIVADVKASGGSRAIAEDQAGRTQRVVIVERLRASIRQELSRVTEEEAPVGRAATAIALTPARVMEQSPIPY
ncbi:DUF6778 family protein [Szabonella alba]|uniref:ABC-type transport auxiliary lipoprotein component domain-containing protein n=1 Tax=Szabonella alba TaxID=2804194 RepID=A0A8K0VCX1_9RHOB|nr:DUF6778 family protein [Szabonella alba]MBL4917893.1 hypothetical protein [Szabonella alba]